MNQSPAQPYVRRGEGSAFPQHPQRKRYFLKGKLWRGWWSPRGRQSAATQATWNVNPGAKVTARGLGSVCSSPEAHQARRRFLLSLQPQGKERDRCHRDNKCLWATPQGIWRLRSPQDVVPWGGRQAQASGLSSHFPPHLI